MDEGRCGAGGSLQDALQRPGLSYGVLKAQGQTYSTHRCRVFESRMPDSKQAEDFWWGKLQSETLGRGVLNCALRYCGILGCRSLLTKRGAPTAAPAPRGTRIFAQTSYADC